MCFIYVKMEFNLDFVYGLFEFFFILILTRKLIKLNVLDPFGKCINDLSFVDWNFILVTENLYGFFSFECFYFPLYQIRSELSMFWHVV